MFYLFELVASFLRFHSALASSNCRWIGFSASLQPSARSWSSSGRFDFAPDIVMQSRGVRMSGWCPILGIELELFDSGTRAVATLR
jgi:hypothetical protein